MPEHNERANAHKEEKSAEVIDFHDVVVELGGKPILENINWTVLPGEQWVILGPNGAGKSTLAALMSGNLYPSSGNMKILGRDANEWNSNELATRVSASGSKMLQQIPTNQTVVETISAAGWGQTHHYTEEYEQLDRDRAIDLLTLMGLEKVSEHPFQTLSEGEQRRALLARALMSDPEVLILDEPTAGLDLGGRETLIAALNEIMVAVNAPAVIVITHELEEIPPEFTHSLLLSDGNVVQKGHIDDVLTDENLTSLFQVPVRVTHDDGRWHAQRR